MRHPAIQSFTLWVTPAVHLEFEGERYAANGSCEFRVQRIYGEGLAISELLENASALEDVAGRLAELTQCPAIRFTITADA